MLHVQGGLTAAGIIQVSGMVRQTLLLTRSMSTSEEAFTSVLHDPLVCPTGSTAMEACAEYLDPGSWPIPKLFQSHV